MTAIPIQWDVKYETGIEEIDLQHRYFLRLINRLAEELATTEDEKYRDRLLDELRQYASFHFISEENLMRKFGYPGLQAHRLLHLHLLDMLSSRGAGHSVQHLIDFLVEWFMGHTASEDRQIGEYIRSAR